MDLSLPVQEFCWYSASTAVQPSALWEPMHQHGPWHACASCGYVPETGATPNAPCQLLKFYKLIIYFGQTPTNRNFHAARYTHRRTQVTESHNIMRGIFRVIKRDEGHDPGADKGECRNLRVETRSRAAFFRSGKAGKALLELKSSKDMTLQQYLNFG